MYIVASINDTMIQYVFCPDVWLGNQAGLRRLTPSSMRRHSRFDNVSVISYALLGKVGVNSAIGLKRRALNRMGQSDVSSL